MIIIPFSGSKRNAYKKVAGIVKDYRYDSAYEPFGGSCVLSVNLYNDGLVEKAVANDYDHFFDDYETYLDLKDKVVELGYKAGLKRTTYNGNQAVMFSEDGSKVNVDSIMLKDKERKTLQTIIKDNVPEKYWRYFALGSNFTFSGVSTHDKIRLSDFATFSRYLKTDKQRKYINVLKQITLENLDYMDFLIKHSANFDSKSLIIVDPPYPKSEQRQYKNTFDEGQSMELIQYLNCLPSDYIYFHGDLDDIHLWFSDTDHTIMTGKGGDGKRNEYLVHVRK